MVIGPCMMSDTGTTELQNYSNDRDITDIGARRGMLKEDETESAEAVHTPRYRRKVAWQAFSRSFVPSVEIKLRVHTRPRRSYHHSTHTGNSILKIGWAPRLVIGMTTWSWPCIAVVHPHIDCDGDQRTTASYATALYSS